MDSTPQPNQTPPPAAPQKNTGMGIVSYLGPLVIIPLLVSRNDAFVMYHAKQGLALFIVEFIIGILGMFFLYMLPLWMLLQLANLGTLVLAILGIIHAAKGEEKELPLIGHLASSFTF